MEVSSSLSTLNITKACTDFLTIKDKTLSHDWDGTLLIHEEGHMFLLHRMTDMKAVEDWILALKGYLMALHGESDIEISPLRNFNLAEGWSEFVALCKIYTSSYASIGSTLPSKEANPVYFEEIDVFREVFENNRKLRPHRQPSHVLLVDDDPLTRRIVSNMLKNDYCLITACDAEEAIANYLHYAPDIVFLDINLPQISGLDILRILTSCDSDAFVVMFSGNDYPKNRINAAQYGAKGFISKPFNKEKLYHYIHNQSEFGHAVAQSRAN